MTNFTPDVDLTGQIALITGAGRGLGQSYAIALAAAGASVVVMARSQEQLETTVNAIRGNGGTAIAIPADVSDRKAMEQAIQQIETQLGAIDLLINNAGVLPPIGPIEQVDPDEWWHVMEVNVRGALICSRLVLPGMIRRQRGRMINIASEAAVRGLAYVSPYGVSKTALVRLSEILALETASQGVSVFAICPGTVRTAMTDEVFSTAGQQWLPWASKIFEQRRDMPAAKSVNLILKLASGKYDTLSGRYIQVADDLDTMQEQLQDIQAQGLYTLRLPRLQPVAEVDGDWITTTLQEAIQNQQSGRLMQAEERYQQILVAQPNHLEALQRLGALAQQMGRFREAEHWWRTLLEYHPNSVSAWFSVGNLYQTQGQLSQAEVAYRQAIALQPNAAPLYNNLGYTLQQQGKLEEAIAYYQSALKLQPNCAEAEANLGNALYAQGTLTREQQAAYATLNHQLGQKYQQAGVFQAAIAYYQKVLELQPTEWAAYNCLGQIYQAQHNLVAAVAIYRQGLSRLNPHYAAAIATDEAKSTQQEAIVPLTVSQATVTVGGYQFPAIPPVADPDQPRPFWTVVIPVCDRIDYVLECLASVLVQWPGATDMEILVLDNASSTPVFEWVNQLGGGVIRYYRHSENVGGIANYNAGIALARGQWVHVLHDDDCVLSGFYASLQHSLARCPASVGVACTGFEYVNEIGKTLDTGEIVSLYGEQRGIMQNWLPKIGVCGLITIPAMVIRRTAHEHLGGYFPELPEIADWEIFKRYASFYDWWYEPGVLARYREHTQKMTPENWRSGRMATALRRAIEVSDTYLPVAQRATITAQARMHNWKYCLQRASIPLKAGNLAGALRVLQETLKIDPSSQSQVFAWLTQEEAAPLRQEIVANFWVLD